MKNILLLVLCASMLFVMAADDLPPGEPITDVIPQYDSPEEAPNELPPGTIIETDQVVITPPEYEGPVIVLPQYSTPEEAPNTLPPGTIIPAPPAPPPPPSVVIPPSPFENDPRFMDSPTEFMMG